MRGTPCHLTVVHFVPACANAALVRAAAENGWMAPSTVIVQRGSRAAANAAALVHAEMERRAVRWDTEAVDPRSADEVRRALHSRRGERVAIVCERAGGAWAAALDAALGADLAARPRCDRFAALGEVLPGAADGSTGDPAPPQSGRAFAAEPCVLEVLLRGTSLRPRHAAVPDGEPHCFARVSGVLRADGAGGLPQTLRRCLLFPAVAPRAAAALTRAALARGWGVADLAGPRRFMSQTGDETERAVEQLLRPSAGGFGPDEGGCGWVGRAEAFDGEAWVARCAAGQPAGEDAVVVGTAAFLGTVAALALDDEEREGAAAAATALARGQAALLWLASPAGPVRSHLARVYVGTE